MEKAQFLMEAKKRHLAFAKIAIRDKDILLNFAVIGKFFFILKGQNNKFSSIAWANTLIWFINKAEGGKL